MSQDTVYLIFLFSINKVWWQSEIVGSMFHSLLVGSQERCVEDWVDLPSGRDVKMEHHAGHHFFDFERSDSPYLELFGSFHMEIGCL